MMSEIQTPVKEIVSASGAPINPPKVDTQETKPTQLPDVQGYRILCMVPQVDETYDSGIIKSDKTRNIEEHSTVVLFVMKLGDMCYLDENRFPTGPW
jgi:hypothetical protein